MKVGENFIKYVTRVFGSVYFLGEIRFVFGKKEMSFISKVTRLIYFEILKKANLFSKGKKWIEI